MESGDWAMRILVPKLDKDLTTDLKSSKLILPSPSWSRSANMMSLSPCPILSISVSPTIDIINTPSSVGPPNCNLHQCYHQCNDMMLHLMKQFLLSLYVGSVTRPLLLQYSGFHPKHQLHRHLSKTNKNPLRIFLKDLVKRQKIIICFVDPYKVLC